MNFNNFSNELKTKSKLKKSNKIIPITNIFLNTCLDDSKNISHSNSRKNQVNKINSERSYSSKNTGYKNSPRIISKNLSVTSFQTSIQAKSFKNPNKPVFTNFKTPIIKRKKLTNFLQMKDKSNFLFETFCHKPKQANKTPVPMKNKPELKSKLYMKKNKIRSSNFFKKKASKFFTGNLNSKTNKSKSRKPKKQKMKFNNLRSTKNKQYKFFPNTSQDNLNSDAFIKIKKKNANTSLLDKSARIFRYSSKNKINKKKISLRSRDINSRELKKINKAILFNSREDPSIASVSSKFNMKFLTLKNTKKSPITGMFKFQKRSRINNTKQRFKKI